jgi:hypothetical protein
MTEPTFQPGDQVAYIPHHAAGDIQHPDVEFGFVTSPSQRGDYFCRYWRKGQPGTLRTVANSECTPVDCMVKHDSVDQSSVDRLLAVLGYKVTA